MKTKWTLGICALVAGMSNVFAQQVAPGEVYGSQIAPTHDETPPSATPIEGEKKSIFSAHDLRERMVKEPDKPVQLKKLKFGGDQTETSGLFKGSLLDSEVDIAQFKRDAAVAKAAESPQPQASASPAAKQKPETTATPSPSPTALPIPPPSAQDRQ